MALYVCKVGLRNKELVSKKIPAHILEACMFREMGEFVYLIGTFNMVLNLGALLDNYFIYKKDESNILDIDTRKYLDKIEGL